MNQLGDVQLLGLHEVPEVLVALLLPVLLRVRVDLTRSLSGHSFPLEPLRVVVTLRDARLAVDVRQPHLPLFIQLPVEGHGVLQVLFVAAVVEEAIRTDVSSK